ncbi:MAG: hypothetical protein K0R19_1461 [Bacillota bacterium]|jgi:hypothetical protein|nr:hypothetical protein [Bacillota bacterium]
MKVRNNYYENYHDVNDEMLTAATHCNRFSRRNDVTSFNMIDYQSCENCRHLTADDQCIAGLQSRFTNME